MNIKYDTKRCPYCGNKCKFPIIGDVTSGDLDIDNEYCLMYNVVNENDETIGYDIWCKKQINYKDKQYEKI